MPHTKRSGKKQGEREYFWLYSLYHLALFTNVTTTIFWGRWWSFDPAWWKKNSFLKQTWKAFNISSVIIWIYFIQYINIICATLHIRSKIFIIYTFCESFMYFKNIFIYTKTTHNPVQRNLISLLKFSFRKYYRFKWNTRNS